MNEERINKIVQIIIKAAKEMGKDDEIPALNSVKSDTVLYGEEGVVDSLGLVNLITYIEEILHVKYELEIILADERAMSQKFSPFRTVQKLAEFIDKLIEEENEQ